MQHLHIGGVCARNFNKSINQDKSSDTFKFVVASVSNNNALSFNAKSSSTFKLVDASVTNKFPKGPTNDSPAKQHSVSNYNPAIENSFQLHVPMIKASIQQLIVALTFERSIEAFPIFQLIDVSVLDENDSCSVFQKFAHGQDTFIKSTSFNDGSFQLVVKIISILISVGAQFASKHSRMEIKLLQDKMPTSKPQTTFDKELRPISMTIIFAG
jgi:hypothetical protein